MKRNYGIQVTARPEVLGKPLKKHQLLLLAQYLEEIRANMPLELDSPIGFAAYSLKAYIAKPKAKRIN